MKVIIECLLTECEITECFSQERYTVMTRVQQMFTRCQISNAMGCRNLFLETIPMRCELCPFYRWEGADS